MTAPDFENCIGLARVEERTDAHGEALETMEAHLLARFSQLETVVIAELKAVKAAQVAEVVAIRTAEAAKLEQLEATRVARYDLIEKVATKALHPAVVATVGAVTLALIAAATGLSVSYGGAVISALDSPVVDLADDS